MRIPISNRTTHTDLKPGNFGFIAAFLTFFIALTALGMEMQKPNKGGGAVTIYKRGQVPQTVEKAMEAKPQPKDIENGNPEMVSNDVQ